MTLTSPLAIAALLLAFALYFLIVWLRLQRGHPAPPLRPLLPHDARSLSEQALEMGTPLHVALGTGSLHEPSAAQSVMGLLLLDELAEHTQRFDESVRVSTADPVAQLIAADSLRRGDPVRGWRTRTDARWIAPQPAAYGAGTRGMIQRERLTETLIVGSVGAEYLLLAAPEPDGGQPFQPPTIAASAQLESVPLIALNARTPLLAEELFALGAYLARWPAHVAGLIVQDTARLLLILAIVAGALLRSAGWWG